MKSPQLSQVGSRSILQIKLPVFEGPFDLLIYLVERDRLDIYSISIADITSSYLEGMSQIEFDPDLTGDFIYMAAYLLELKSRSLLPRVGQGQLADEPDPRQELIMRLVEYKRFKELAEKLAAMISIENYDHTRLPAPLPEPGARPLAPLSLDNLFSAFARVMENSRIDVRQIVFKGVSIEEKIVELRGRLATGPVAFAELTRGLDLHEIVATFLAILELVRLREALVFQEEVFAPILIEPGGR